VIAGELRGELLQESPGDGPIKAEHRLAMRDDLPLVMADPALGGVGGQVIWLPARAPED
jgi:hypothetical protein